MHIAASCHNCYCFDKYSITHLLRFVNSNIQFFHSISETSLYGNPEYTGVHAGGMYDKKLLRPRKDEAQTVDRVAVPHHKADSVRRYAVGDENMPIAGLRLFRFHRNSRQIRTTTALSKQLPCFDYIQTGTGNRMNCSMIVVPTSGSLSSEIAA